MKCPRCQQENPPQAKFCLECGASTPKQSWCYAAASYYGSLGRPDPVAAPPAPDPATTILLYALNTLAQTCASREVAHRRSLIDML